MTIKRVTEIPGPRSRELMARRDAAVPRGPYNVAPIFVARASGAVVEDVDGNTYIDFAGGIGSLNAGACAPDVVDAIRDQAGLATHTCFHVAMTEPYIELAERLNRLTPGKFEKRTFFANSGAEAVENAVKIARVATGRSAVIAFEDAFHGRTLLAMSLTSKIRPYKAGFGPFAPEVYRLPYGCTGSVLESAFKRVVDAATVAAVIVEPVLGEGGFVIPPREFLADLESVCRANGIVLIVDEVQTGMARTGTLFATEQFGIEPDIIIAAKSLGGGLPISSITGRAEIMDAPAPGSIGGTFGGNPIACRAALAVLDIIERDGLCERARVIGARVMARFEELKSRLPIVADVRGLGAMCAMELREPADRFAQLALQRGLLTITAGTLGNVIRTLMPLVITDAELDEGLDVVERSLAEAQRKDAEI